jgi:hypothetical protein
MKKIIICVCALLLTSSFLFADDSGLDDLIYGGNAQGVNSSNSYKAEKYKKDAEKIKANNLVSRSAPADVQKAVQEYNSLEKDLKKVYLDMSKAYENNDNLQIAKFEMTSWKIKEQMKIVNEKKSFAYQISEFQKALKDFPDSQDMHDLIKNASNEANQYIDLSKEILVLLEKQHMIRRDFERKQGEAQIIRQKEVLKNMQKTQSKKYGN